MPLRLAIGTRWDAGWARQQALRLALDIGMSREDAESAALAAQELATNLARYARDGEIVLSAVEGPGGPGIQVETCDSGPGIADVDRAMQDGFSTGGGMGSGLPAARRLMDELEITSDPQGTRVVARKWPSSP